MGNRSFTVHVKNVEELERIESYLKEDNYQKMCKELYELEYKKNPKLLRNMKRVWGLNVVLI